MFKFKQSNTFKRFLIGLYLSGALLLAGGSEIQIITPNGTTFGHVYPNGDFILQGPGGLYSEGKLDTTQPLTGSSTYGYRSGDTTIILTPSGPAFEYGVKTPR